MRTNPAYIIAVIATCIILIAAGIVERRKNEKNLAKIPIRINVNGIRGKSTITRFITGILTEADIKTIGKTTGTAARMIYWDKPQEKHIVRPRTGPRISEQLKVIQEAADYGAEALVCECMAVNPDYQDVYTNQMLKPNITVIVNILEDHLDVMGPTTEQIAWAFAETIPENGTVIIPDTEYKDVFIEKAKEKHSKVVVVKENDYPDGLLDKFDYEVFPNNCAMALAVARELGIDDETAVRGMLNAHPEPGAARIFEMEKKSYFVNGFAANEPSSTLEIWERIKKKGYPSKRPIIVMNCRPDRVDRTIQFIKDFIPYIENATLVAMGEKAGLMKKAYEDGAFPNVKEYIDLENRNEYVVAEEVLRIMPGRTVLTVGNIHGIGLPFLILMAEHLKDKSQKDFLYIEETT